MPEPTTQTAVVVAVSTSSASVAAGTFLGVEFVVFGLALLGATVSHIWIAKMAFKKMLFSIFGSFVLGVVFAQISTNIVLDTAIHFFPWLIKALSNAQVGGKMLVAFCVAFIAQKTVPIVFKWLDSKGGAAQ